MSVGRRSRGAALALLLGVIAVLGAAIFVPAALYWSKTGATIQESRLKIQRTEKRSEAVEVLNETKAAWSSFAAEPRSGFVLATTDEDGISATTARLRELFARFKGDLTALNGAPEDGPRTGVRQLNIDGSGNLPRKNLGPFLTALESDPAFLIISAIKVTRRSNEQVRISFTASAYRLLEPGA